MNNHFSIFYDIKDILLVIVKVVKLENFYPTIFFVTKFFIQYTPIKGS